MGREGAEKSTSGVKASKLKKIYACFIYFAKITDLLSLENG
jgi:hypothetical protein